MCFKSYHISKHLYGLSVTGFESFSIELSLGLEWASFNKAKEENRSRIGVMFPTTNPRHLEGIKNMECGCVLGVGLGAGVWWGRRFLKVVGEGTAGEWRVLDEHASS